MRSGFIVVVGRTGVGKSTLVNAMMGTKVSIVSRHRNTTRNAIRGVLNQPGLQAVFVDTPGFHKPRTRLGSRLNDTAEAAMEGVDLVLFVVDATQPIGAGDERVASVLHDKSAVVCALNKVDRAPRPRVVAQLARAGEWDFSAYFPVSALTGEGVQALVDELTGRLPEGTAHFPATILSDMPEAVWVAELVREALLENLRKELPHSLACRVTDWDGPYIRCEIFVERRSQKPIVIGRRGSVLKRTGEKVRAQLGENVYLDLVVKVAGNWQSSDGLIDSMGYGGVRSDRDGGPDGI
jgi:GTP-binding protein Era